MSSLMGDLRDVTWDFQASFSQVGKWNVTAYSPAEKLNVVVASGLPVWLAAHIVSLHNAWLDRLK